MMRSGGQRLRNVVLLAASVLLVAGVAWLWSARRAENDDSASFYRPGEEETAAVRKGGAKTKAEKTAEDESSNDDGDAGMSVSSDGDDDPVYEPPSTPDPETESEREEKLVDAFDALTDKWREPADAVTEADIIRFHDDFCKVPKSRQEECLQRALNLVPDDNAMLLVGILLDKELPKEMLETVFNDVLNRDETVKQPILRELYKDKEHPCWADVAWILDATGEVPAKK